MTIDTIAFDADDTLWHSENHFSVSEDRFKELLSPWADAEGAGHRLLERERANLRLFGYGVKGFTLSMIESAIEISDGEVAAAQIQQIIDWGKQMMDHPIELLPGVEETVEQLRNSGRYRLLVITKGDLLHQESKLAASGLADRFDHVEIVSEKAPEVYQRILDRYDIAPDRFLMVGNSVRSDILPVLDVGGHAAHIPYGILWAHERVESDSGQAAYHQLDRIIELPDLAARLG
jgi:putative hydrolase of the HAD superfamily